MHETSKMPVPSIEAFSTLTASAAQRIGNKTPCFADPELWFSDRKTEGERAAVRACGQCHLRTACADWAMETKQPDGVWGGITAGQREALLKQREARKRAAQKRARAAVLRAERDAKAGQEVLVLA